MAKTISKGGKKASRSGKWAKGGATAGTFSLGREAFTSISAVEGITLSKAMRADFKRTDGMSADKRRSTLASKYGKK